MKILYMHDDSFPAKTTETVPIADVKASISEGSVTVSTDIPLRSPSRERSDYAVWVRARSLEFCRSRLKALSEDRFPIAEVLLGASTACIGAVLGALTSGVKLDSALGIIFYVVLSAIAIGTSVAYGFCRHFAVSNSAKIINDVLEELPNPDDAVDMDGTMRSHTSDEY